MCILKIQKNILQYVVYLFVIFRQHTKKGYSLYGNYSIYRYNSWPHLEKTVSIEKKALFMRRNVSNLPDSIAKCQTTILWGAQVSLALTEFAALLLPLQQDWAGWRWLIACSLSLPLLLFLSLSLSIRCCCLSSKCL